MANTVLYGFEDLARLSDKRVYEVGTQVVDEAINTNVAFYNAQVNALTGAWVESTTMHSELVHLPASVTLQPLTESGNPKPVGPSSSYTSSYPIQGGGYAWGDNRVTRAKMTIQDVQRHLQHAQFADKDWLRRHILAATFDDTAWTFVDEEYGSLTIQPLANGDSVTYARKSGSISTDDHYLAQANTISDTDNPFPTIYDELFEHPSNRVSDQFPVVAYIPQNIADDVEGLTAFTDQLPMWLQAGISSDSVAMDLMSFAPFADQILGVVGGTRPVIVGLWGALPSNYIIAHATGAGQFLKMREHEPASLQGFFQESHSPDGNHNVYRFLRYAGFGVYDRVAALAYRIGNASYAVPSGYDAPLPA